MSGLITLNDLKTKFRSAGQYTVIVDNTLIASQASTGIMRLVAGFSKSGNWNAPFFINRGNTELAKNLYGDIDPLLERKKSFFQRSILNSLEEGDVLALNLLKTVDEVDENGNPTANADVVDYIGFSLNPKENNGVLTSKLYASFYNKERFWSPSPEYLLATRKIADKGKLFNIVNLGQRKVSVLIRKTTSAGYNQKVRDWFGGLDKVPAYMNPDAYMRDYFVDVYVIAGDYTNYNTLKNDIKFSQYFNERGLIVERFNDFISDASVTLLNMYTGSIVPSVRDINGNDLSIDTAINRQTALTGLLASLDYAEFDAITDGTSLKSVDLTGSGLVDSRPDSVDFLSYKGYLNENAIFAKTGYVGEDVSSVGVNITNSINKITVSIPSTHPMFEQLSAWITVGTGVMGTVTSDGVDYGNLTAGDAMLYVTKVQASVSNLTFELSSDEKKLEKQNSGFFVQVKVDTEANLFTIIYPRESFDISTDGKAYEADINSPIAKQFKEGRIKNGDAIKTSSETMYIKFTENAYRQDASMAYPLKVTKIELFADEALTQPVSVVPTFGSTFNMQGYNVQGDNICVISVANAIQDRFEFTANVANNVIYFNEEDIDNSDFNDYVVGDYILGVKEGETVLAEVTRIYRDEIGGEIVTVVEASEEIYVEEGKYFYMQKQIEDMFASYNLYCLNGFQLKENHMPNGTNARMKEILSVMTDTQMRKGLVDPDFINYRYYVDTFNHGIEPSSKRYITRMLMERQRCLGLLNAPSVEELKKSVDPRFTTSPTPVNPLPEFDTKFLLSGGNLAERPKNIYSLPNVQDGVAFAGWFFPNIIISEDGYEKNIPPASYVGNAFMRKWNGGNYGEAVAGSIRGVLTGDGILRAEIPLDKEERGDVKLAGMNPIYKKGNNLMIYGNSTGLMAENQGVSSILQHIHARDILIQMEIDMEGIMNSYEFAKGAFSDDTTRTLIETSLDNYLERQRDTYGNIVEYTLQIDSINNPSWVVESGAMLIDVGVRIAEVTDRFITRITLNRQSANVTVGSFTAV